MVVVLSRTGPAGIDKEVAANSLAELRFMAGCAASNAFCWPHVPVQVGQDLLVATSVQACHPVVSVTGSLRHGKSLFITINHSTGGPEGCSAAMPGLWLFGVPRGQLPRHIVLAVEVRGGGMGLHAVHTSVRLP